MRRTLDNIVVSAFLAAALSGASVGLAQDRDRDRTRDPAAGPDRIQDRDQDRIADRDRIQDRAQDRLQDRDQDRLQDRGADRDQRRDTDRDQDRDRLRQQLHVQDQDQLRARDIYGYELMTRQERREYRARIRQTSSVREWARYRAEHQARMTARAREQGADLPPPFYGQQLMTDRERLELRERLQNAAGEPERARIRNEHREQMQQRARGNDVPLSDLE